MNSRRRPGIVTALKIKVDVTSVAANFGTVLYRTAYTAMKGAAGIDAKRNDTCRSIEASWNLISKRNVSIGLERRSNKAHMKIIL